MTAPSSEIIREVRAKFGPRTMLSFSRGKDAIAAWLAIRDHFEEVVPYHLYLIPGLEFVEESLAYYERAFKCKIHNLPHPQFYKWMNCYLFQTPPRAAVIGAAQLPNFDYVDIVNILAGQEGIAKPMVASGVRAADSPIRRVAMQTHGAVSLAKKQYYPIWDWNMDKLIEEIARSGVKLPVDYDLFGRSFDGIDLRFMLPLKKHRPADYRKVVEWFPLVELEVWRYERFGPQAAA
ncbi:MAG: hypothetical protein ACLPTZ_13565 [Beijerinckiaceae bacterium]